MEKISIIVPIYNVAPYLPACLDSIIHQTYLNLEIILVDDGSTDSSNKICEQYKTVDPRIQVIHQKNQGVSTARNAGLALAAGHYITFADADDLLEPSLLAECIKAIETGQTDVLYHGFKKDVWKSGKVSSSLKGIPSFEGVLSENQMKDYILAQKGNLNVNVFSYIFTRELIADLRFNPDLPYAEDAVFVMQALSKAQTYYFSANCDYHYNVRAGSAAYRWQPKLVECYRNNFMETRHFLESLELTSQEMEEIMSQKYVDGYASLVYNLCLPTCTLSLKEKYRSLQSARTEFRIDHYKRFYSLKEAGLFQKAKTFLIFRHFEIFLILFGTLYCKKFYPVMNIESRSFFLSHTASSDICFICYNKCCRYHIYRTPR